jgi:hypothetical protein
MSDEFKRELVTGTAGYLIVMDRSELKLSRKVCVCHSDAATSVRTLFVWGDSYLQSDVLRKESAIRQTVTQSPDTVEN